MYQVLTVFHVIIALAIIGLVLIQQGRGADAGTGFGGASSSLFGARGASTFLSKSTAILATLFFLTSLTLAFLAGKSDNKAVDIMDAPQVAPVAPSLPPVLDDQSAVPKKDVLPATSDVPQVPAPAEAPAQK